MASSLLAVVAGVAPELTVVALPVVPVLCEVWSIAPVPPAPDSPEYSSAATPTSALEVAVTVIVGLVPPPAVIGAVHTLISALSDPLKFLTLVYVFPAESVTLFAVALEPLHTPTRTTQRLPAVMLAAGVTVRLVTFVAWLDTCCTNAGATVADGVTAFEGLDGRPVPIALVAVTVKV